jgi:hypothetical protein
MCGAEVIDDVCTNPKCAVSIRSIGGLGHRGKAKDAVSERITEFPTTLNILLGITELPPHFAAPLVSDQKRCRTVIEDEQTGQFVRDLLVKTPDITPVEICRQYLIAQSKDLGNGYLILPDDIRKAMKCSQLCADYIWTNAVRYKITGYRPKDFKQEDRDYFLSCYRTVLEGFYKEMNTAPVEGKGDEKGKGKDKIQKNHWSIQSIMKQIMLASPRLMNGHTDFYESLHTQNTITERVHAAKFEKMSRDEGWKFQ